eukprot:44093_1
MESLQQLELEFNGLSGEFPGETNLKSLEKLNLADQYLNDHECIRSDGTLVNSLFMRGDQANPENLGMAGEILGPQIGQLPSLKEITIHGNSFSGSIAPEIGSLQNLVILSAGYNIFSGVIPQEIVKLASLRELWFEETWISGELPHDIGNMTSLESLGLYNVYMSGVIPDSLYDLSDLRELFLRNNNPGFEGALKANIGNLTKLTRLDISGNTLLTGTLPSELGNCEDLGELLCMCVGYQLTG